jgi:lipopolysaccharide/colanic/teichoic acid biosynthesis glycosyltransferase
MYHDSEEKGPPWTEKDDARVTRVGRILRRRRIDELPQLINIIKGEMCFIGPRPEKPELTHIHGFEKKLSVKPGLTGWAIDVKDVHIKIGGTNTAIPTDL